MAHEDPHSHLSRITTLWSMLERAHEGDTRDIGAAQREIVDRYSGAAYRYLVACLRSPEAADEVFQEFALKVVKGGYRNATPERGRFRDYVKRSLGHLVADYFRRKKRNKPAGDAVALEAAGEVADADSDRLTDIDATFTESCREELLERCWNALELVEATTGQALYSVLKFRAESPDANSQEMAESLTTRLKRERPLTAPGVRKMLQLAREKFASLLLYEVSQMIGSDSLDDLEAELIDLGLKRYCHTALTSRREEDESSTNQHG